MMNLKKLTVCAALALSSIGFSLKLDAGPIIVGNASGISEFNLMLAKGRFARLVASCRKVASCDSTLSAAEWSALETATLWLGDSTFSFLSEIEMPGETHRIDVGAKTLVLNKSRLWVELPTGDVRGMTLPETVEVLVSILGPAFRLSPSISNFQSQIMALLARQVTEYEVTLSNDFRLAVTNIGNGEAGLALIYQQKAMTQMEVFDFGKEVACETSTTELAQPFSPVLADLTFAFFTGPFPPNPDIDMSFYGSMTYECRGTSATWQESAKLRFTLKIQELMSGTPDQSYDLVPTRSRIRFDSISRLPSSITWPAGRDGAFHIHPDI